MKQIRTELRRYDEADWAPLQPGADWAWRVTLKSGEHITGAIRGTKSEAQARMRAIAQKMKKMACGDITRVFRIRESQDA